MKLDVTIELLSPLQFGSGQENIIVDSDAVHDAHGLPYFPGKRLKGLLYESAIEMAEIGDWFTKEEVDTLFGHNSDESYMRIDNMYLENYEQLCNGWNYLQKQYQNVFTAQNIWNTYTELRVQTAIDKRTGTTKDGSLHNMRVVDDGLCFSGSIYLYDNVLEEKQREIIKYALLNLRYVGAKRNRGFGHVKCRLVQEMKRK